MVRDFFFVFERFNAKDLVQDMGLSSADLPVAGWNLTFPAGVVCVNLGKHKILKA